MRAGTIAFLSGILLLLRCSVLPPVSLNYLLIPLALVLVLLDRRLRFAGCMLGGFIWALICAHDILAPEFARELEGQTLTLTGHVVTLPEYHEDGIRFEFQVDNPILYLGKHWPAPGKIRLGWYHQSQPVRPGQRWQLTVRLKRPHGFMNPGGFDYEGWVFQHRIKALGYVVNTPQNHYTGTTSGAYINRLRDVLRAGINRHLDNRYRGLIIALTLGDSSQTSRADRLTMINTGTYHLLAISGLQISLVAGFFYMAVLKLWSRTGTWAVRLPAPRVAALAALAGAAFYALVAGFSIPTQRALVMFAVLMSVLFIRRHYAVAQVICMALLAVLVFDPFAVMDPGFWLSFGAIMALAWGMSCRIAVRSLWWRWGRAQYVVFVGLLPLSLLWFQQYAVNGILANIVAIPWISLVTTPLGLAGMALLNINATLGQLCLFLAGVTLQWIWPLLEWLSQWHFSVWHQAAPSPWSFLCASFGAIILLLPSGITWRWLGILWLLPLLLPVKKIPGDGEFWFTLLDVGEGLATVVHTREHTLVYDTGARYSDDFNAGAAVVVPYLRQTGVSDVDTMIISHGDNDHIGGAADVLAAYPDTMVLSSVPSAFSPYRWRACRAGQQWQWDGIKFQMLNPEGAASGSENNQSCVLRISNGRYSVLLPGDIEKESEYRLVTRYRDEMAADVLVAPHHGSKTSSTATFINTVQPRLVLFPVGYRNRFRFPNQDIMKRYEMRGVRSYDTARDGAILLRIDQTAITATTWRKEARRFWHAVD